MATYSFQFTQTVERTINLEVEADSLSEALKEASEFESDDEYETWDEVYSDESISRVSLYRDKKPALTMTAEMVWGQSSDCPSLGSDPQRAQAKWDELLLQERTAKVKGLSKASRL